MITLDATLLGDLARAHVARPLPEDRPGLRRTPVPLLRPSVASAHQQWHGAGAPGPSSGERRITGRKHVGPKLVRIRRIVGAGEISVNEPAASDRIANLPHAERRGFQTRRQRNAKLRGQALTYHRNPAAFLATTENS